VARTIKAIGGATGLWLAVAAPAHAQTVVAGTGPAFPASASDGPAEQIDFAADQLEYQNDTDVVTASGDVRMVREGNRVRADRIVWNRKTGKVRAIGNVRIVNPGGDIAYGDSVELTDTLKDGMVDNLLIVLIDGGRIAARRGVQADGISTLDNAAYSPCPVTDSNGCPKNPSWKISAVKVIYDPVRKRIRFNGARLDVFGIPIAILPGLVVPTGSGGGSGLLIPNIEYNRTNGVRIDLPYYFRLSPNRDLTLTPRFYSAVQPTLEGTYRALTDNGAYRIGGFVTYSRRLIAGTATGSNQFRGYLDASGKFQIDPLWSVSASVRRVTDRTLLRRYDLSYDDKLRSTLSLERIDRDSYFALNGWAVQTLQAGVAQGGIPIALPEIDYRRRFDDPLLGGRVELQLNSLALARTQGQDTQRAFAGARWDLRRLTNFGQEIVLTAYARGDVYHSKENALTATVQYRGNSGWQGRAIGALAAEIRWPLVGALWGGTQRLTPRLQIVASPPTTNLNIPNEDARSVDLEDSNLFALNRFPGYDRWEDGARVTYGLDWNFDAPRFSVAATVGQSYRLNAKPTLFPDGTGLNDRLSDIVGRTTIRYRDVVTLTHRYRLDKDGFALRRNEVDATIGDDRTYALIGYLRLNRNISSVLEDLRDREEIRVGGRVQVTRYISVFGSATVDLTDRAEDPLSIATGYQPVRHRLGIAYTDDCLDIGFTWKRDYDTSGDAQRGDSYLLRLAFRNLGR
jgi:LPS-assembly protein